MIKFFITTTFLLVSATVLAITFSKTMNNEKQITQLTTSSHQNETKMDLVISKLDRIHSCLEKLEDRMDK